jgi:hypothetical protein
MDKKQSRRRLSPYYDPWKRDGPQELYRQIPRFKRSLAASRIAFYGGAEMHIDPWLALGVFLSTAATDAVYVLFNAAVSSQRRVPAATWSSVWYLLSAFAVISYTKNWMYVGFAASGSWVGAFISMTLLRRPPMGGADRPGLV